MILDRWGNPIDTGALREPQTETSDSAHIAALRNEFDNHPGRNLTPARLNAILRAAEQGDLIQQLELADDMEERDGQIFAELAKRKSAVAMLDWDVVAPDDATPEEKAMADEVKDWMRSIPQFEETILIELMDAVLKGFKGIEMWWEPDQATLQPRFAPRPQRWLCLGEDRNSLRLRDGASQYGVPLQPYGWLLHQHNSRNGYMARGSLARVLCWPYLFKFYAVRDLAEFLEIYGLPIRLGKYPAGASDPEKRKLLQAVAGIGHNAGGVIPQSMSLDLLDAASGTEGPFRTMWTGMDAVESKIILGQTLTSSEGQNGTQALGNVHNEVRKDILKSDAKRIAATLTAQLITPMVLINKPGADPRRMPRFVLDVEEPEDISLYAEALPKLAAVGMRIGVKDLHRRLGIEMAAEGEAVLGGAAVPAQAPAGAAQSPALAVTVKAPAAPLAGRALMDAVLKGVKASAAPMGGQLPAAPAPRDALDDLVDSALADWAPVMSGLVSPLLAEIDKAVAAGETMQAFRARLSGLGKQMDSAALTERIARATFTARLAGEADLDLSGREESGA